MALVITTHDWVPDMAKGVVCDLCVRWACDEAGPSCEIDTTSVRERTPEHSARQPFGQVPILHDRDLPLFENGAILLYLGESGEVLRPRDPVAKSKAQKWLIAGLNTLEQLELARFLGKGRQAEERAQSRLQERLRQLAVVLEGRDLITAGCYAPVNILICGMLRALLSPVWMSPPPPPVLVDGIQRMTVRPGFRRGYAARFRHFAEAA